MPITPVQRGERTISHVKLISHFHLRGTVTPSLLHRVRDNRMLEVCCSYLTPCGIDATAICSRLQPYAPRL